MIQAARSGKQNIVEGSAASTGSRETELKLLNVARASFQELLVDYEDYLRVRELECWPFDSEKGRKCREVCYRKNDSSYYREAIRERSDTAIANIAITLIHQEDVMLRKLIEAIKRQFVENGGIREEMSEARIEYRKRNGNRREDGNK